ncbi:MOSC domain-containing protein [Saccharopolyspora sp. NFXS83]|uniref:MOSC domain-containing protein n=1 Tax=Saccharopolyspora sp. NFXS83 TaxID=2993560 RepID=UPI00224AB933|nr:MOSC domain-containing protein [Saccharopolyspora sp. NFXS83]MCX2731628.1 MOSC domain-containing protein [Saccharopolyspora sp. NFXS83]
MQSVNVAVLRTGQWTGRMGSTGIDKRPVPGPIRFTETGVGGDRVIDTKHHGAWYQAAYAFDVEDLRFWSVELGKELVPGNAGENLSLSGCDSSSALVGERWRVGGAVLRVTGPRTPCRVFAGFWDVEGLVKRFAEVGRPGAYLAVERAGEITADDPVEVLSRPDHLVTVADVLALGMGDRERKEHVAAAAADLPEKWRASLGLAELSGREGIR